MTDVCECEDCAVAAHRMKYIAQLMEWAFPHIFTAHSKVIVHFNQDNPDAVEIEQGHQAQEDMLKIFRLIEEMHLHSREISRLNKIYNGEVGAS